MPAKKDTAEPEKKEMRVLLPQIAMLIEETKNKYGAIEFAGREHFSENLGMDREDIQLVIFPARFTGEYRKYRESIQWWFFEFISFLRGEWNKKGRVARFDRSFTEEMKKCLPEKDYHRLLSLCFDYQSSTLQLNPEYYTGQTNHKKN